MIVPVPLIRRNYVMEKLREAGAISPETAVTLAQAGVINPNGFRGVTRMMLRKGLLERVEDRFYLKAAPRNSWLTP